jgi:hypothetical protein
MKPEVCQCPGCICELGGDAVRRGDRYYCCGPCAEGHGQDRSCRDPECPCLDKARARRGHPVQDSAPAAAEHAPEESFPAREFVSR